MKVKKKKIADLWLYLELFRPFTDEAVKTVASWLGAEPMSNETFVETLKRGTEFLREKGVDLDGYVKVDNREALKTYFNAKRGVMRSLMSLYDYDKKVDIPYNVLTMQNLLSKWVGIRGSRVGEGAIMRYIREGKGLEELRKKSKGKVDENPIKMLGETLKKYKIDKKPEFPLYLDNKDIIKLIKRSDGLYKIYRNRTTL